jgi:hypothetical protein
LNELTNVQVWFRFLGSQRDFGNINKNCELGQVYFQAYVEARMDTDQTCNGRIQAQDVVRSPPATKRI